VVHKQLAHAAIGVGEHRLACLQVHHALVHVHRAAWLAGHGLGHEGCAHVMLERRFAHGALENNDLVSQGQRRAVTEVDLHLRRAFFVDQGVQIQPLGFAPVVHVFKQRVEFVGGFNRIRLAPGFLAAGAPHRWFQRIVRVGAALSQVELHFGGDNRFPAARRVQAQDLFQQVARRQFNRIALFVIGVVNDLCRGFGCPGHDEHCVLIRAAVHVDIRRVQQFVVDIVFYVIAGHCLQQDTLWQAHALLVEKLVGGRDFAPGDAAQIRDQALDFSDFVFFEPMAQSIQIAFHNASCREMPERPLAAQFRVAR